MGHLTILMLLKEHFNQTTFTGLEFLNFTIFDQKILKKNVFGQVK